MLTKIFLTSVSALEDLIDSTKKSLKLILVIGIMYFAWTVDPVKAVILYLAILTFFLVAFNIEWKKQK